VDAIASGLLEISFDPDAGIQIMDSHRRSRMSCSETDSPSSFTGWKSP
jgi:hypothetical protein